MPGLTLQRAYFWLLLFVEVGIHVPYAHNENIMFSYCQQFKCVLDLYLLHAIFRNALHVSALQLYSSKDRKQIERVLDTSGYNETNDGTH